jgi:hypothetical protein
MHESNPLATQMSSGVTLSGYGEVSGPAANAALATITDPPVGVYEVTCEVSFVGTAPAAAEDGNVEIRVGASVKRRIATGRGQNVIYPGRAIVAVTTAGDDITANANAAATAGCIYVCSITAERIRN